MLIFTNCIPWYENFNFWDPSSTQIGRWTYRRWCMLQR